jgi:hypothetical protein
MLNRLGQVLTECASDGLTGVIRIAGEPGGVVQLTNGAVTAIDTPGAPGPEVILLRSGRVAESGWTAAFAAAAASVTAPNGAPVGGGVGGAVGAELIRRDLIGAGELEALLRTALADAMFALAAGELAEYEVDKNAEDCVLPLQPAVEPAWLLAETSRRLAVLASLPAPVEHDRDRWTSARGGGPAGLVLGTGQETILALANGRRTARDMAFVLGRGVYAVTLQLARMHAEGLLVPGTRRAVPGQAGDSVLRPSAPEEHPQTVTPADAPTVPADDQAGPPPPPLPRRRRGSASQPRRARSVGQMDRASLLRLLRPGAGTDGDPGETME